MSGQEAKFDAISVTRSKYSNTIILPALKKPLSSERLPSRKRSMLTQSDTNLEKKQATDKKQSQHGISIIQCIPASNICRQMSADWVQSPIFLSLVTEDKISDWARALTCFSATLTKYYRNGLLVLVKSGVLMKLTSHIGHHAS